MRVTSNNRKAPYVLPSQSDIFKNDRPMRDHKPVACVVVLVLSVVLLIVAASLDPEPVGVGTHRQMGLPACGLLVRFGIPCATCGMTTAVCLAVQGRMIDALTVQPAGAVLAVMTSMAAMISAYGLLTGASLGPVVTWLWRPRLVWAVGGVLIGSWLYKIVCITWMMQ